MSQTPREGKPKNGQQLRRLISIGFFRVVVIPYVPLAIGLGISFLLKAFDTRIAWSLGLFVVGFRGILRMIIYRQKPLAAIYSTGRITGDLLFMLICWGGALYFVAR